MAKKSNTTPIIIGLLAAGAIGYYLYYKNTADTVNGVNYNLIFEDIDGNELERKKIEVKNLKEAKKIVSLYKANSMLNDLYKIVIRK